MTDDDRESWNTRWAGETTAVRSVPAWFAELDAELPRHGRGLDVASGNGRIALWAAKRGLDMEAVDVSDVALEQARAAAEARELALVTHRIDLERAELPAGPYALIACVHYEQASLWPSMIARLAPGGCLLVETHTRRNLERHPHPSQRWLVPSNELLRRAHGLTVVYYREGWLEDRHVARLLARRS